MKRTIIIPTILLLSVITLSLNSCKTKAVQVEAKPDIAIAGKNFDILGCHNYEYESENFQTGALRIQDYLVKLRDYIRASEHPGIKIAVLEWGLCRTYDWCAGMHAAGSLIAYEKLGPELELTCPALLLRNTEDGPLWSSFIYHDHVSWFPGSGCLVEKLFREHFAEQHYASTSYINCQAARFCCS